MKLLFKGNKFIVAANIQIPYFMLFINIFITGGPCLVGEYMNEKENLKKKNNDHMLPIFSGN